MFSNKRTKIIATIGPSSQSEAVLESLIKKGIDAARLNFSHGSYQEHQKVISAIRKLEKKLRRHIAIIVDVQGPKIRVGTMPKEGVELKNGEVVVLDTGKKEFEEGIIPLPSGMFRDGTKPGHRVFLDDGLLQLEIISKEGDRFKAKVVKGGILFSKKGINVPSLEITSSLLSTKDKADMAFAVSAGADYIALSFLRNANDIIAARSFLKHADIKIIAKIERPEALKNLDEITDQADAVMVARGDLGIETPLWELPVRQKEIVDRVRKRMKPVIVATQMLDSMIRNPIPTRAEVSDIANAVYDATDAVMLSGETASGKHPEESVEMMRKVLEATEIDYDYINTEWDNSHASALMALVRSAALISEEIKAKGILIGTVTGKSALMLSHFRPKIKIIGITEDEKIARELALAWGVGAIVVKNKKIKTIQDFISQAIVDLKKAGSVKKGETLVCVFGDKLGVAGRTNTITVKEIT